MRYMFLLGYRIVLLRKLYHLAHPAIVLAAFVETYVDATSVYLEMHTYRIQLTPKKTMCIAL